MSTKPKVVVYVGKEFTTVVSTELTVEVCIIHSDELNDELLDSVRTFLGLNDGSEHIVRYPHDKQEKS